MPAAPPNPYKFAGKVLHDGVARHFLANADRVYEVKPGEDLDGGYRVESIEADRIVLVYLPLGTRTDIAVAGMLPTPEASEPNRVSRAPVPTPTAAPAATGEPSKPAQLRWEGPDRVRAGANFNVALRLSSDQPLRATPMQLRFDSELLEPIGVRPGKFFGQGSFSYRVNPEGSIFIGATAQGAAPGVDAELLIVTFRGIKAGATAEVTLSSVSLQGAAGRAIEHQQVSAFRTAIQ